jgi:hypothetical protein
MNKLLIALIALRKKAGTTWIIQNGLQSKLQKELDDIIALAVNLRNYNDE